MTEYADLPQEVKDNTTEEAWNALMAELAEVSERARELMKHHA